MDADSSPLRTIFYSQISSVNYLYIGLIILLIFLSAFFASAETTFSCCNRTRINSKAEDGDSKAIKIQKMLEHFDNYLVSILIFTNIAHIATSTLATVFAVSLVGEIGSLWSTIIITLLVFIFSETLPKNIAKANADKLVYIYAWPIRMLTYLIYPIVLLFSWPYKLLSKHTEDEDEFTEEDLSTIIDTIEDEGVIDEDQSSLIQNAIDFDDTQAREIYTPIKDVVGISIDLNREDFIKRLLNESKYSRLPVYKETKDNIQGVVYVRLALKQLLDNKNTPVSSLINPPHYINYSTRLDELLDDLIKHKTHMGFVKDSKNKVIGIITMDDILDELIKDKVKEGDKNE